MAASDSSASLKSQLTFTGTAANCDQFIINKARLSMRNAKVVCLECAAPLIDHRAECINDDDIVIYLAHAEAASGANCVLEADLDLALPGRVFLGGRSASLNPFVEQNRVRRVCNCSDLHLVSRSDFQTWAAKVEALETKGVLTHVLRLCWLDEPTQKLWRETEWDQLVEAVRFVHESRRAGDNCVVHCAQGKSRSGAVIVAYFMALYKLTYADALKAVQQKRTTVQPNIGFEEQLQRFEKSAALAELREFMSSMDCAAV